MTKTQFTFNALDGYFQMEKGTLNIDYFRDCIEDQIDIVWRNTNVGAGKSRFTVSMLDTSRKIHSLVWLAYLEFAAEVVKNEYGDKYAVTSEQLKKYLEKYGYNYKDVMKPIISTVEKWREQAIKENGGK
jgi:hypothetical protein